MKNYNDAQKLHRVAADKPDFKAFERSLKMLRTALATRTNDGTFLRELGDFQDTDGSFKLIDSWRVPSDARVDFCYKPTYLGAALLMRDHLHEKIMPAQMLEGALTASLGRNLLGHGFTSERGLLNALGIFQQGGLTDFLVSARTVCPVFHALIWNILDSHEEIIKRNSRIIADWEHDFTDEWEATILAVKPRKRLYLAYGSNMSTQQMHTRCPGAKLLGKTYIKDWALKFHYFADIEPLLGEKTPATVWEITANDEGTLDSYEGFPKHCRKNNLIIDLDGIPVSAMVYVMTEWKKTEDSRSALPPNERYLDIIRQGYLEAGFTEIVAAK